MTDRAGLHELLDGPEEEMDFEPDDDAATPAASAQRRKAPQPASDAAKPARCAAARLAAPLCSVSRHSARRRRRWRHSCCGFAGGTHQAHGSACLTCSLQSLAAPVGSWTAAASMRPSYSKAAGLQSSSHVRKLRVCSRADQIGAGAGQRWRGKRAHAACVTLSAGHRNS